MSTRIQPGNLVGFLLFFSVSGYLQFRAIRGLRSELVQVGRTSKIRGYLLGWAGFMLFLGLLQVMIFLAIFRIPDFPGQGPLFLLIISLILTGFLIGNRQIIRLRKKRRSRRAALDTQNDQKND